MKLSTVLEEKDGGVVRELVTISSEATVHQAIEWLCQHRIGALLVVDGDKRLIGIATERDVLMSCCGSGQDCREISVSTIMSRDVVVGSPDDSIENALQVMTTKRIRHLPVVDGDQIVGILSIGDILRRLYRQDQLKIRYLSDYLGGTYGLKVY